VRGNNLDSVRRNNLSMVLDIVHRRRSVSRSEITRATGLNRSTVAALVGELAELDLIVESSPDVTSSVGRPSPIVTPHSSCVAIAVNPELDAITVGVVGLGGVVHVRLREEVDHVVSAAETVEIVARMLRSLDKTHLAGMRVAGLGLAVPGLVRASDGLVRWAPHLGWTDEPITVELEAATGHRTVAGNDASLGALAEHIFGAGIGVTDLVYLNGGASGIGGGVIANGAPLGGVAGYAGEFGQNRPGVRAHADRATVDGTLEDEVSRARLLAVAGLATADETELADALLASDDAGVRAELARQSRVLSVALSNAVNVLNPQLVVLGGFLAAVYSADPASLEALVAQQSIAASFEGVRIEPAALGADLLMIGAAQLVFEQLIADPAAVRR
jgi:predicted NBD/HSP70 family sugar kinase